MISLDTVGAVPIFFLSPPPVDFFLDLLLIIAGSGFVSIAVNWDLLPLSAGEALPDDGNPSFRDS